MNFFTLMLVAALQTKSESNLNLTGDQLISWHFLGLCSCSTYMRFASVWCSFWAPALKK